MHISCFRLVRRSQGSKPVSRQPINLADHPLPEVAQVECGPMWTAAITVHAIHSARSRATMLCRCIKRRIISEWHVMLM